MCRLRHIVKGSKSFLCPELVAFNPFRCKRKASNEVHAFRREHPSIADYGSPYRVWCAFLCRAGKSLSGVSFPALANMVPTAFVNDEKRVRTQRHPHRNYLAGKAEFTNVLKL